ncbi:MAG: tail fiber domain-containing protein, partial [Chthoniobacterales bacterium]|nr:tail fiber domain-containing protein [Chthoniobacterales bacterium]
NRTGTENTASSFALGDNATGDGNTATGALALHRNTIGNYNTATGAFTLSANTTGNTNVAMGREALRSNDTGNNNVALGSRALVSNTTGNNNAATGKRALYSNTIGSKNTANGRGALYGNTTGNFNTALGVNSLAGNTTGNDNIALGNEAGLNLTVGSNNIDIGAAGVAGESGRIRIGTAGKQTDAIIAGIYGNTIASGVQVIIGSGGKLGTVQSSARYKQDIKPMKDDSAAVLALEPVTFHYKEELDPDNIPQFGLIAEQVEKVNPDLVARDDEGKITTVRYEAVNAMLLNEFLKEHQKVEEQERKAQEQGATISELRSMVAQQQKQIATLTVGLQKVNNRINLTQPTPQTAANTK